MAVFGRAWLPFVDVYRTKCVVPGLLFPPAAGAGNSSQACRMSGNPPARSEFPPFHPPPSRQGMIGERERSFVHRSAEAVPTHYLLVNTMTALTSVIMTPPAISGAPTVTTRSVDDCGRFSLARLLQCTIATPARYHSQSNRQEQHRAPHLNSWSTQAAKRLEAPLGSSAWSTASAQFADR